jgi:hypothetical protein
LVTAVVSCLGAVMVNLATSWKTVLWAWLAVAVLTLGSAVTSLWLYRSQAKAGAAVEPTPGQEVRDSVIRRDSTMVRGIGGNLRIGPVKPGTAHDPPAVHTPPAVPPATGIGGQSVVNSRIDGRSIQVGQVAGNADIEQDR